MAKVVRANAKSSDESYIYADLNKHGYDHETVHHGKREYVRGTCHTNGIENFWKHLKQGIKSTHVAVSRQHLEKYVKEFECRFNFRHTKCRRSPR